MDNKQSLETIRREAQAKIDKCLEQGRDGGEIACPNWPEDHEASLVVLNNGKKVTVCLECGYDDI
jgi:hypothetical protein